MEEPIKIETENKPLFVNIEYENIRLTKNSSGDYSWTFVIKDDKITIETLNRLEDLNKELKKRFESKKQR